MVCNNSNFDLVNITKLEECKSVADAFKTGAGECLGKTVGGDRTSADDACACWTNATFDETVQAAKECKFNEEASAIAAALKTCKKKFAECRQYEDEVAESVAACNSNADDLKKSVAALSQNADKVKEAQDVVKALAASRRVRRVRRDAAESCTEVTTIAVTLTTLVLDFPSSPDVLVFSATIIASSSVVCTDEEKEALAHLDEALKAAQSQLMTLTGATASPEEIAEIATQTTAASGETTAMGGSSTMAPVPTDMATDETTTGADTTPGADE